MTNLSIGAHRQRAISAINDAASEARSRHYTSGAGQEMVYAAKIAQAQAYITAHANNNATATAPAYVAADVSAVGGTALAAAQAIVAAADAFHAGPGPAIEQARRSGKLAVQASATPADVELARDAAVDQLNKI